MKDGVRVYLHIKNYRGDGEVVLMSGQFVPSEEITPERCTEKANVLAGMMRHRITKMAEPESAIRRVEILQPGEIPGEKMFAKRPAKEARVKTLLKQTVNFLDCETFGYSRKGL